MISCAPEGQKAGPGIPDPDDMDIGEACNIRTLLASTRTHEMPIQRQSIQYRILRRKEGNITSVLATQG